jgi:hypothetical protein
MPRRPWVRLALLPLALVLLLVPGGCGGGTFDAEDRPLLIGSVPAANTTTPTGLNAITLHFDEPIRLFLTYQVRIFREGVLLASAPSTIPGDPDSIRVRLLLPDVFAPGTYDVQVLEGLVLDQDDHYALEPQIFRFEVTGTTPDLFVGSPTTDAVTALDAVTFAPQGSTPTPGARDPVALTAELQGATPRVFVQLASGGGNGRSLAHFLPGAPAMTECLLTTSGGDLVTASGALVLDPAGGSVYAAYRDVASQRVRLARVRTSDGVELGSLLLSVPAAADTFPTGVALRPVGATSRLVVASRSGGSAYLTEVDLTTFTELDLDGTLPGAQGIAFATDAGPAALLDGDVLLAPASATTADLAQIDLATATLVPRTSVVPGAPTALRVTFDRALVLEGLDAGPLDEPLASREPFDLDAVTPVDVNDDVGGVDQGTTRIHALGEAPGQRLLYVLLDANCLALFTWDGPALTQVDLDAMTLGTQAVSLTGSAAGATCIGTVDGGAP